MDTLQASAADNLSAAFVIIIFAVSPVPATGSTLSIVAARVAVPATGFRRS